VHPERSELILSGSKLPARVSPERQLSGALTPHSARSSRETGPDQLPEFRAIWPPAGNASIALRPEPVRQMPFCPPGRPARLISSGTADGKPSPAARHWFGGLKRGQRTRPIHHNTNALRGPSMSGQGWWTEQSCVCPFGGGLKGCDLCLLWQSCIERRQNQDCVNHGHRISLSIPPRCFNLAGDPQKTPTDCHCPVWMASLTAYHLPVQSAVLACRDNEIQWESLRPFEVKSSRILHQGRNSVLHRWWPDNTISFKSGRSAAAHQRKGQRPDPHQGSVS